MASDSWTDFDTLRHSIKFNTVDRLKQILTGFNDECSVNLSKSGKKQDIIDRLFHQLDNWKVAADVDKWVKAKRILRQVKESGVYSPVRMNVPASGNPHSAAYSTTHPLPVHGYPSAAASGSTTVGRYDPYAPPRKPTASTSVLPAATPLPKPPALRFKSSPFFQFDSHVSEIVSCPESASAQDRRSSIVNFTLTADQVTKLNSTRNYELRLFCTSSTFYTPNSFRTNLPCPIEFPPTCEVRVNGSPLQANLKGLKKKPGTAPPAALGATLRISASLQNRIEMVYVNSQQPPQAKKFYIVISLVEVTDVTPIVDKLKAEKLRSSGMIRASMREALNLDDDIVAGPARMSLKCPLSFMRINTPCRSSRCVHSQCFDATSWFSVMQQTTTWLCPVCEKELNFDELLIDGYFDEILKSCPDSVEDVIVENNGEWHTTDNKYASTEWRASHPTSAAPPPPPPKPVAQKTSFNGKAKETEIYVIDSDEDEDEGRVKRELSPSFASGSSSTTSFRPPKKAVFDEVIDLTLDSDEDDMPPPPKRLEKRKASTPLSDVLWKKSRFDNPYANGAAGSSSSSASGSAPAATTAPALPPRQYIGMPTRTLPVPLGAAPLPQHMMPPGMMPFPMAPMGQYPAPPFAYGSGDRERHPYPHAAPPGQGAWR